MSTDRDARSEADKYVGTRRTDETVPDATVARVAESDDLFEHSDPAVALFTGEHSLTYGDDASEPYVAVLTGELSADSVEPTALDASSAQWQRGQPSAEDWQERIIELEVELAVTEDPAQRVTLLITVGAIHRDELSNPEAALDWFDRALQLDPSHDGALGSLASIHRERGEDELLFERLLELAERSEGPERAKVLRQVARLYEEEGDPEKAAMVLDAAQQADPTNMSVVRAIGRVAGEAGPAAPQEPPAKRPKPDPLQLLQQELQQTRAVDERVEIYEQMAALWIRRGELERAVDSLEQILLLDVGHERALTRLQEIHHHAENLEALADVLERHIDVAPGDQRPALCRRLAHLCEGSLRDPARARGAYVKLLASAPGQPLVLRSLARLSEELGDWDGLCEALLRLADVMPKASDRADCFYRVGWVTESKVGDPNVAEGHYRRALELHAGQSDALERLLDILEARGDWGKAVEQLLRAEPSARSDVERAALLCRAARSTLDHLEDEAGATDLFERALALEPGNVEAADALAERYGIEGRHADLLEVVELLLRKAGRGDPERRCRLLIQSGDACYTLKRDSEAAAHYREVLDLDPEHLLALQRVAELAAKAGDQQEAYETARRVLLQQEGPSDADRLAALRVLARSALELGKRARATEAYRQVLQLAPTDHEAHERLAELQADVGDWHGALEAKEALLGRAEGARRRELLVEIGDLQWKQVGRTEEAERAYIQALDEEPGSHLVLHRLLDLYSESRAWGSAVAICQRLAQVESTPELRAKYMSAAGLISRDELDRPDEAIDLLNQALDQDPMHLKAFEALDKLCTERRDWKRLENAYGRMLQRLPEEGHLELKVTLWHNLGEVLRSRRRDFESAVAAFEAADRLAPGNAQRRDILAELYLSLGGAYAPRAIPVLHEVIRDKPNRIDAYHTLWRLYREGGQRDRAWCIAAVLTFLRRAESDQRHFHERYRNLRRATSRLTDSVFRRHVMHPEQDQVVSAVFAAVAPIVASVWARPHSDFGLRRKDRRDLGVDQVLFSRIFVYVTEVLGVPLADVHLRNDVPAGLLMAHTVESPSFVVGSHLLEGRSEKDLAFAIGRQLAFLRPEHLLRNVLTTRSHLRVALLAALRMCNAEVTVPLGEEKAVEEMLAQLRRRPLHPAQLEALATVARSLDPARIDITRWWNATELTADRVGLILCNDMAAAAGMICSEPESGLPVRERIAHLVRFAASEAYFQVRSGLGVEVGESYA